MSKPIQSVQRAFALLECLATHTDPCGVRELARIAGLTPPTALAILKTLTTDGYVTCSTETRRYQIGQGLARLMRNTDEKALLSDLLAAPLNTLHQQTSETVVALGILDNKVEILFQRQSTHALGVRHTDLLAILHRLAAGQVLLAWQDKPTRDQLLAKFQLTKAQRSILEKQCTAAKSAGHAELINLQDSGIAALAMPVGNTPDQCRVAIGISAPTHRFSDDYRNRLFDALQTTISSITL